MSFLTETVKIAGKVVLGATEVFFSLVENLARQHSDDEENFSEKDRENMKNILAKKEEVHNAICDGKNALNKL